MSGDYALGQNYPNPFNPGTRIIYKIPKDGDVQLTIYDLPGREVFRPVNGFLIAGTYALDVSGENLASGAYYYPIKSQRYYDVRKMIHPR